MSGQRVAQGIEVRGDSIRIVFTYRGQRCRPTLRGIAPTPKNIKFAAQKRQTILYEINQGSFNYAAHFPDCPKARLFSPDATGQNIGEALEKWLIEKQATTANSTFRNYRSKAKHVASKWGNQNIITVVPSDIREWINGELSYLSNKTINEILIVMRGVFASYGLDNNQFNNPFDHITNLEVLREEPDPWTRSEIDQILTTKTTRSEDLNMIEFAIWSGPSVSEYIALAWEDVNLEKRTVKIQRARVDGIWKTPKKDKRTREIELLDSAYEALIKQRAHTSMLPQIEIAVVQRDNKTKRTEKITPVFINPHSGAPYYSDTAVRDRFLVHHLKLAKVRYRGPNNCRHTFASQMLTIGMPKEWIAKQMGHTSTLMIDKHYGKWITEDAPNMAKIASERLEKPHTSPIENEKSGKALK